MLRKACYGVAFLAVWMVSVGVTAGVLNALRASGNASSPAWTGHPNPSQTSATPPETFRGSSHLPSPGRCELIEPSSAPSVFDH
jgi:hypothetical protein